MGEAQEPRGSARRPGVCKVVGGACEEVCAGGVNRWGCFVITVSVIDISPGSKPNPEKRLSSCWTSG